jgi:hypothetical protein
MAKYVKVAGAWKAVSPDTDSTQTAYVKVGGTWLGVTNAYIKVAGTWRSIFTYSAFIVPNVVNQVLATGRANITNSGNTAGTNTILNNANGANPDNNGKIASQSVTPGVYLTAQTVNVSYYVFAFITVPNLLGQTASAADTLLSNSGNTKGSVVFTASGATANNHATVASQTIPAGSAYTTAQTVGYTLYNYTVPTPSRPSVSLVSKGSNTFTFQTFFGANTTSALAYYGPSGQGNQVFWGTINSNGGTAVVTGLTPGASYSFMSYPVNTENVNTLGSVQQGGLPSLTGSGDPVTLDNVPAPTSGSISQNPSSGAISIGSTISGSTSGWNNNPTSVEIKVIRGTAGVVQSEVFRNSSSGTTSASVQYVVQNEDYSANPQQFFRVFARASNAGGTSNWISTGNDIGPVNAPGPTPPNPPSSVAGEDILSPIGGRWSWTAGSGGSGSYSYYLRIYNNNGTLRTGPIALGDRTYDYTQAGTFYATVETFDLNTGLTSTTARQSATVTFTGTAPTTPPSASASNDYVEGSSPSQWILSITHTGGGVPTSYSCFIEFANSSGGPTLSTSAKITGTWTAGNRGTQTVSRTSGTYSWARWSNVYVQNSATSGDGSNASGSPTPYL